MNLKIRKKIKILTLLKLIIFGYLIILYYYNHNNRIKAFDFLGTKVSGGKLAGNKGISNMVTRIITEEENYMKLFDLAFKLRAEIVSKIQALKNLLHVRFLFKYYVEGKSLETISNEVRKSYSYIKSIKRKALEDFEKRHSKFLERAKPALQSVL